MAKITNLPASFNEFNNNIRCIEIMWCRNFDKMYFSFNNNIRCIEIDTY